MRTFIPLLTALVALNVSAGPPNLPDTLDSDNGLYRLRYDDNIYSVHYMPPALIQSNADALDRIGVESQGYPLGYHDGYVDLGFLAPTSAPARAMCRSGLAAIRRTPPTTATTASPIRRRSPCRPTSSETARPRAIA
jgi:hypothetical protein